MYQKLGMSAQTIANHSYLRPSAPNSGSKKTTSGRKVWEDPTNADHMLKYDYSSGTAHPALISFLLDSDSIS